MAGDTYQDQYIKLERVGAYIRKTEGKIKKYQEQLGKLRQKGAQKNLEHTYYDMLSYSIFE